MSEPIMQTGDGDSSGDYDAVLAAPAAPADVEPAGELDDPLLDGDLDAGDDDLDESDANQAFLTELRETYSEYEQAQVEQQLAEAIQAELEDPYSPHFGATALEVLAALAETAAGQGVAEQAAWTEPEFEQRLATETWREEQRIAAREHSVTTAEATLDNMIAAAAPDLDPADVRARASRIIEHVAAETGLTGRDLAARAVKEAAADLSALNGPDYDEVFARTRRWERPIVQRRALPPPPDTDSYDEAEAVLAGALGATN